MKVLRFVLFIGLGVRVTSETDAIPFALIKVDLNPKEIAKKVYIKNSIFTTS
jgi:hypothetical protein